MLSIGTIHVLLACHSSHLNNSNVPQDTRHKMHTLGLRVIITLGPLDAELGQGSGVDVARRCVNLFTSFSSKHEI